MNIRKQLIPINHLSNLPHGYANGYVGVPPGHPWYGINYNSIDVDVHGGLTFSEHKLPFCELDDEIWWVGFDVCHYGDDSLNCDKTFCLQELERLYQQALAAIK